MAQIVRNTSRFFAPVRLSAGRGFFATVFSLLSLNKTRRDLAKLDQRALRDVGLTEEQANLEANRPIWDVPTNWRL